MSQHYIIFISKRENSWMRLAVHKHSGLYFVSSMTLQYQMDNFVQRHNQFQYTKIEETYGVHLDSNRIDAKLGLENELVETTVQLIWCYQ